MKVTSHKCSRPGSLCILFLCSFLCIASVFSATAQEPITYSRIIVVTPHDGEKGIQHALEELRTIRKNAKTKITEPLRVVLEPGEYTFSEPLVLTEEDSGTADSPTIIEARLPGQSVVMGAEPSTVTEDMNDSIVWRFMPPVKTDAEAERSGGQFFVNGHRATLARQPNKGDYYFVGSNISADSSDAAKTMFMAAPKDAAVLLSLIGKDKDRAIVKILQSWSADEQRLQSITTEGKVTVSPSSKWPFLQFGDSQRYYIENIPAALDAAGEWILTDGLLLYKPLPQDEHITKAVTKAYWPRLQHFMHITGSGTHEKNAQYIQINGLRFEYTGEPIGKEGFIDTQAAIKKGAAIEIDNARFITFTHCAINHIGAYGVWLRNNVSDSEISDCIIDDAGAGGIKIGTEQLSPNTGATEKNKIIKNVITNTGAEFPGAVGIWVGKSSGNLVSDNIVAHTSYTGISVGWQWGFDPTSASNNMIVNNVLFDIGEDQLSDEGAIYTLGRSPGTVISGNFIRHVADYPAYGAGAWGIYNDEGSSNIVVKGNIVLDARSGSYHLHYGRDNLITGNLFAGAQQAEIRWSNPAKSGEWRLEHNGIPPAHSGKSFDIHGENTGLHQADNNTTLSVSQGSSYALTDILINGADSSQQAQWQAVLSHAQQLLNAAVARKTIIPPSIHDLKSPAARVKPVEKHISLDLDHIETGARPSLVHISPALPINALAVARDENGPYLLLRDGAPAMAKYDPHFYFPVNYAEGRLVVRFSAKIDANSELVHEWRDGESPYNTGPSLALSASGLHVGNRFLTSLPLEKWVDFEISQDIGNGEDRWQLRIRKPKEGWITFSNLGNKTHKAVSPIRWIGFFSNTESISLTGLKAVFMDIQ